MANAVTMGRAYVVIGAKLDESVRAALSSVSDGLADVGRTMQKWGAGMMAGGAAVTGTLKGLAIAAIQNQAAFAEMATRTGASVEFLSEVGYAAGLADISLEEFEGALNKMSISQQKLQAGSKRTVDIFTELGLSAKDLAGLTVDEQFVKISEGLSKVADQGKRATIAREIFGRGGMRMLPLVEGGAEGLGKGRAEAARVGANVTTEAAEKAHLAERMFARLHAAINGLVNAIGSVLIDRMTEVLTMLTNLVARTSEYARAHPELVLQVQAFGQALLVVGASIVAVGASLEGLSYLLSPGGIFTMAAALVLYLTGALDGLIAQWKDTVLAFQVGGKTIGEWLGLIAQAWAAALPSFAKVGEGIVAAFAAVWEYLKAGAVYAFDSIGAALKASFWKAVQSVADAVLWMLEKITEAEYASYLIDDKQLNERMAGLQRWKKNADSVYGGLAQGAKDQVKPPEFKTPDFSKIKEGLGAAAESTKDILGKPIGDAIAGVLGKGESKVKSLGDILKDLSRPFGEQGGPEPTRVVGASSAIAKARRVDMEVRGAFSAAAIAGMTGRDGGPGKGQEKQIALQTRIADNTERMADSLDELELTYD